MAVPYIPAWCPHCGFTFRSSGYVGDGSAQILYIDGQETCPRCGEFARIFDGEWAARNGVLRLMSGPRWTHERLRELLDRVQASATAEAAWDLVEREVPDIAAAVRGAVADTVARLEQPQMSRREQRQWQAAALLVPTLVAVVLHLLSQHASEPSLTLDQVQRVVEMTMEGYRDTLPVDPTPDPPAAPGHELGTQT